jgi:hypothetical protein
VRTFSTRDQKVGIVAALVASPFALGIAAFATSTQLVHLFGGSEWFTFKATFGVLEILVFGIAAAASSSRDPE